MKRERKAQRIFQRGSTTYFYSSMFFPRAVRDDVTKLYAFVRTADDFVDATPQDAQGFAKFVTEYHSALAGKACANRIILDFLELSKRKKFNPRWADAFFSAMRADLTKKRYATLSQTERYMYGSAEVIGLYMAAILGLPRDAHSYAQSLGKAFQYVNFLRDVAEDEALGRTYIPIECLRKAGLKTLTKETARANPKKFSDLVRAESKRYLAWQHEAEKGFHFIPWRYRVAISTASDAYAWTARQIMTDPMVVWRRKVKPSKLRILWYGLKNMVSS